LCTLIAYTDSEGNERRFEYDAAGHLTARINAEGKDRGSPIKRPLVKEKTSPSKKK
jgi:YD repeat-containing protein